MWASAGPPRRSTARCAASPLQIGEGEIYGLVGESGCGKTLTALAVAGLLPPEAEADSGEILFDGRNVLTLPAPERRALSGGCIGMVFQEPHAALNPLIRVGRQIGEPLRIHTDQSARDIKSAVLDMMNRVGLDDPERVYRAYPHQLSGGMAQRAIIAMALILRPALLIADEPTTALDVPTQEQILQLLRSLCRDTGTAMLFISHDLDVVARLCDRVGILYAGRIVEEGSVRQVMENPLHPYANGLIASIPGVLKGRRLFTMAGNVPAIGELHPGCAFAPRCPHVLPHCPQNLPGRIGTARPQRSGRLPPGVLPSVQQGAGTVTAPGTPLLCIRNLSAWFDHPVLDDVSLDIRPGEMLGLVGESGGGKTTLARSLLGLDRAWSGELLLDGTPLNPFKERRVAAAGIQAVFQDPYSSLNPAKRVGWLMEEPLRVQRIGDRAERKARVSDMLARIGLDDSYASRTPQELSGGQRQRVAIGSGLIVRPRLLIADEPVSSLDVSVQAQILNLMKDLQEEYGFSCLFITHDLRVARFMCDRIAVLYEGRIVEMAETETLFAAPRHEYTRALLAAPGSSESGK